MTQKYQQDKNKKLKNKICAYCKEEFISSLLAQKKRFCSKKCYLQSDHYKEMRRAYYQSDKYKEQKKKFNHSEKGKKWRKEYLKKYRQTDSYKEISKKYVRSDKSKEKIKESTKKYRKNRRKSDPIFRLVSNMRTRLHAFLKAKKIRKYKATFKIIGCSPEFLKEYLEKQFHQHPKTKEVMTWENHTSDGWHIDHRIPLDKAKTVKLRAKILHYTNLQPMWAEYNLKKSNK
jgi:hypothetical protein